MPSTVRGALDSLANSRGRSTEHLLVGVGVMAAAVLGSAIVARLNAPTRDRPELHEEHGALRQPWLKPPGPVFSAVWPPLFMFFGAMPFYMAGHYLKDFAAKAPLKLWTVPALTAGFALSVLAAHALVGWRYQSILAVPASLFGIAAVIALSRQVFAVFG